MCCVQVFKIKNERILHPFLAILFIMASLLLTTRLDAQDGELQFAHLGQCKLENGAIIDNCTIGYRTHGTLNKARDNAVLMPTWLLWRQLRPGGAIR